MTYVLTLLGIHKALWMARTGGGLRRLCPNHFGPVGYMRTHCQFHLVQGRFLSACACAVILWIERDPPMLAKINGLA